MKPRCYELEERINKCCMLFLGDVMLTKAQNRVFRRLIRGKIPKQIAKEMKCTNKWIYLCRKRIILRFKREYVLLNGGKLPGKDGDEKM